jgi:hypothetical protein
MTNMLPKHNGVMNNVITNLQRLEDMYPLTVTKPAEAQKKKAIIS